MKKSMVSHGTSKRRTQLCTFIKVFMKWNFVHQRFYLVCDDSFLVPKVSEELLDTKSRIPKMHRTSSDSFFFFFPVFEWSNGYCKTFQKADFSQGIFYLQNTFELKIMPVLFFLFFWLFIVTNFHDKLSKLHLKKTHLTQYQYVCLCVCVFIITYVIKNVALLILLFRFYEIFLFIICSYMFLLVMF